MKIAMRCQPHNGPKEEIASSDLESENEGCQQLWMKLNKKARLYITGEVVLYKICRH